MRAPLSWIRDFTPVQAPVPELVRALNQLGLEVDAVERPGEDIDGVLVARVLSVVRHPNADKLTLVDLDIGDGETQVVCGASNVVADMMVPYAPPGARIPGGITLEQKELRGVVSNGMILSERELGLGDDHEGILGLEPVYEVGGGVRDALGLDDTVFDIAITPNRPDAMSVVGVARELAAHFGLPFTVPEPAVSTAGPSTGELASLVVDVPDRCPRYVARVATVTMGPSPKWLARRLVLAGMRPISNVVDVTNYVLLERGQPLHAFDRSRLGGSGIVVRLAEAGERMTTLDGVERELTEADLLICDADRAPQAIAGIMGGRTGEVSYVTTEVLLESAYFEPTGISKSSRRLGLRSESSARFERGTDPEGVRTGADRACELFAQVAAATVAPDPLDEYPQPHERPRIEVRTERVNAVLGTDLAPARVRKVLQPLEIEIDGRGKTFTAIVPSFRPDLEREIDLVEEVARRVGFDEIGRTIPRSAEPGGLTRRQQDRRFLTDALVGMGALEAMTVSLVAPDDQGRFGLTDAIEVANPLRAEESVLRMALVPALLQAAAFNAAHGQLDVALFEVGAVFGPPTKGELLPDEREHVAAVLFGWLRRRPVEDDRPFDVYDAVDLVAAVADALGLADLRLVAGDAPGYEPGRTARVLVDGSDIGQVGELAADVVSALRLTGPVVGFEIDAGALYDGTRREQQFREVSTFPPSSIDLAFVVAESVPAAAVRSTLRTAAGELLEEVRLFDTFRSEGLQAEGRKSMAFALRFRASDRTLTEAEVGDLRNRAIDAVTREHGAELRA
ncbi:MAG: phenylalanine--tRNA ligase subunit beta [Acidimicrobiia bacterium]